ncbi:hypothetical protein [uncultured Sphaerochaeta sp.]|uniref:hypothetical protein n=2 Tax=Sphaerochaeta TaxID=399320 RepID=UPI0026292419|nr:hypothetical protein [uncultured Sphaerochaeta sp.]
MGKVQTCIVVCLLVLSAHLPAQSTATWLPKNPLYFEQGFSPLNTNKLVAHMGSLTIKPGGNQLFDPNILNVNLSTSFQFTGPITWSNHWQTGLPIYENQATFFTLYAVSTVKGVTQVNPLYQSDGSQPLRIENGNLNVSLFTAELYLVSDQDWWRYQPGGQYTLTNGTFGGFQVAVANNGGGYWPGNGTLVPVNNNDPTATTPFLSSGTSTPPQPVPFGEPTNTVSYLLSILDNESFSITQAYGTQIARVARAQLTIANAASNTSYGVQVVFNNRYNNPYFSLHLDGLSNLYSIPYTLHFNGQDVVGGSPIGWLGLLEGTHTKDIQVTKVDSIKADMAPAGIYSDTITINITPIDTI